MIGCVDNEFDIRLANGREPTIVEQDALAVGRVTRHALLDKVGAPVELCQEMISHLLAVTFVGSIDGVRVLPIRVFPQEREETVAVPPQHDEAEPRRIERQVLEQPLRAFGNWFVIAGDRSRPLRRALIHGEFGDLVRDRRDNLHR